MLISVGVLVNFIIVKDTCISHNNPFTGKCMDMGRHIKCQNQTVYVRVCARAVWVKVQVSVWVNGGSWNITKKTIKEAILVIIN